MKLAQVIENVLRNVFMRSHEEIDSIKSLLDSSKNIFVPLENNQLEVVPIEDILYVHEVKNNLIIIRTQDQEYKYNNPVCDLIEFLSKINTHFKRINNGLCANLSKVVCYDSYYRKVYFAYNENKNIEDLFVIANGTAINNAIKSAVGKCKDIQEIKNQGAIFI
jgi:DNA-binding LytR/AlgR family response regulator